MENKYIKLRSKNKIAFLYMSNLFEDYIEESIENNRLQVFFVYKLTEELENLLKEYRENQFLKLYCESFKHVNFAIAKYRKEII